MRGTIENATQWYYAGISPEPVTTDDDDVDPLFWWLDTESGDIYNLEPSIDDAPSDWVNKGPLAPAQVPPGYTGDNAKPDKPTLFQAVSEYHQHADGTDLPVIRATWVRATAADIIGYELQWDAGSFPDVTEGEPVYQPADWLNAADLRVGSDQVEAILQPVIAGGTFDVRIRAYDMEGFHGDWVTFTQVPIVLDTEAPSTPTPTAVGGYRLVGVYWLPVSAADLSHYEVQHRVVGTAWPSDPLETRATTIVITGLEAFPGSPAIPGDPTAEPPVEPVAAVPPGTDYEIQVRAVDHSGNASAWSASANAKSSPVGQSDIAFISVIAQFMQTGTLSANDIIGGSMKVGGLGQTEGLRIYDVHGHPIGAWGDFGWIVADPHITPHSRAIWAGTLDGELGVRVSADYSWDGTETFDAKGDIIAGIEQGIPLTVWTTAVGPDGINAEAIKFGAAGGGSNRILNAGVELQAYPTVAPVGREWTESTDWDDVLAGSINLNVGTADLKMTAT